LGYKTIKEFEIFNIENRLLTIADNILYQYSYESEGLSILSEFVIN